MYFFFGRKKALCFLIKTCNFIFANTTNQKKNKKNCQYHFKKIVISPNNFKIVPIKIFTPLSQTGTYIYVFDNLMVIMEDERFEP